MSKREGRSGIAGSARAAHSDELRPRFVPMRETMKRVSGEVPTSVSDDLSDYIEFVTETTGLDPKPTAGEILAAALREYFKGDKSFAVWKARRLAGVSGEEVDKAVESLVAAPAGGAGKGGGQAPTSR